MINTPYRRVLTSLICWPFSFLFVFSQTLEIHQISVGQGDAALIIVRDTVALRQALVSAYIPVPADRTEMVDTAMKRLVPLAGTVTVAYLIDTGQGKKQSQKIENYMDKAGVTEISYLLISHYDKDHIGGFPFLRNVSIEDVGDRGEAIPIPSTKLYKNYKDNITRRSISRDSIHLGTKINLYNFGDQRIELLCTSVNSYVLGDNTAIPNPRGKTAKDENDLSVSWVLQYGCFRFFTGGDLSGYDSSPKIDIETALATGIQGKDNARFVKPVVKTDEPHGHICAFKTNHHGSEHSTNPHLLSVFQPVTAIISCGYNATYRHPRKEVIERLEKSKTPIWKSSLTKLNTLNSIEQYYITSLYKYTDQLFTDIGDSAASNGMIAGDVVIVVDDDRITTHSEFSVFWNGESPGEVVNNKNMRQPNVAGKKKYHCHEVKDATGLHYIAD